MSRSRQWIFLDCDSTLSAIEGVDELARMRPREVFEEIVILTDRAMNGEVSLDEIFAGRLEMIRPTREECEEVGRRYIERIEPTAEQTVRRLRKLGWYPAIISGGYTPVIRPLAAHLGIDVIEAVDLYFDEAGKYTGFEPHPNSRNGGKPEVIRRMRQTEDIERVVMVGDGISDLETKSEVDLFIGFGRYARREKVEANAHAFVTSLIEVIPLVQKLAEK